MASIVKHKSKNGTIYVYENESYWDSEKKQPRSHRHLIGKIDPVTGEVVPTGKRGPKKQTVQKDETASSDTSSSDIEELIAEKNEEIKRLRKENRDLLREKDDILKKLSERMKSYS